MSNLRKMDNALTAAKSVKEAMQTTFVKELVVKNYQAITGRKDGENYYNAQIFTFLTILNEKPELKDCDRFSMLGALVYTASTGLSLQEGHVDLIKYGTILKAQMNYKGHRQQLRTMPQIKSVDEAVVVVKGEEFVWDKANAQVIKHISKEEAVIKTIDDIRYSYVRINFTDGTHKDVVVTNEDLKKAKSKSKNKGESSVWEQWTSEMCKKVAVHRAWKNYYEKPEVQVTDFDLKDYKDDGEDIAYTEVQPESLPEAKQESAPIPEPVKKQAPKQEKVKDDLDSYLESN